MPTFPKLAQASAALTLGLALALFFLPGLVLGVFGVAAPAEAAFVARRTAVLFLGLGVALMLMRHAENSHARHAFCGGMVVLMLAMAALGLFEWGRGTVGLGIWLAVLIELIFGAAFLWRFWRDRGADAP